MSNKNSPWILPSTGLPEIEEDVFVAYGKPECPCYTVARIDCITIRKEHQRVDWRDNEGESLNVLAWMPIPKYEVQHGV